MVDLKELKKLVKYLRKEGITEFKSGDLEFKLNPIDPKPKRKSKVVNSEGQVDVSDEINVDTDEPSTEELLFWSSGGPATEAEDV